MGKSVETKIGFRPLGWPLALILLYWFTRLHNLDSLPVFLDEGIHINWARLVWRLQPFHPASDGKLLSIWLQAIFWPFTGTLWVARASTVLAATVGFATMLAFAYRLLTGMGPVLSGILYIVFPLTVFFDRMALVDAVSASEVILLLYLTVHATRSTSRRVGFLAGLILAVTLLTKLTNIVFIIVPLMGLLILSTPEKRRLAVRQSAFIYLTAAALVLPTVAILIYFGGSDLGFDLLIFKMGDWESGRLESVRTSLLYIMELLWIMGTPGLAVAILSGAALTLWNRKSLPLYLSSILVISTAALVGRTEAGYIESRYLMVNSHIGILLAGYFLSQLWGVICGSSKWFGKSGMPVRRVLAVMTMAAVMWPGISFLFHVWNSPHDLPMHKDERWEYITGWPSGYGFREIAQSYHARGETVQLATFDLGGWQRLSVYLPPWSDVTPVRVSPDEFASGITPNANLGRLLLVLDHPKDDEHLSRLHLDLTTLATYPRPGHESVLKVYAIEF